MRLVARNGKTAEAPLRWPTGWKRHIPNKDTFNFFTFVKVCLPPVGSGIYSNLKCFTPFNRGKNLFQHQKRKT